MQTAGVYHFKVIPLTKQGKRGQAAESAWRNVTEAEAAQNREEWGGKSRMAARRGNSIVYFKKMVHTRRWILFDWGKV